MEKERIEVVCAIVQIKDKILCCQRLRKGPDYIAEHWEFPGGKVEKGEKKQEALQREIKEEMDWDIVVGKELGEIDYDYPDFSIHLTAFNCSAVNKSYKLLEHIDAKWLAKKELNTLLWIPADAKLIAEILTK